MIAGSWTYRSYRNSADLVDGDAEKALALIFGEGIFALDVPASGQVRGTLDMGSGYLLDLAGTLDQSGGAIHIRMAGLGRAGTPTAGWEYDYDGHTAYLWPAGVQQVASITGTVLRAKPHNGQPAGVTASFIAVRHS